ncbi:TRAP transporter small permease [Limnohabitans sp. Rim8]|uniref:TRAP transporter small permease n=1 Tax=Limnohabitans sp. Rim8 TaxID=1100718 RepID=UPI0026303B3E|nr:TRAP transporter small permease [Limnohabitans sp. Rim8]
MPAPLDGQGLLFIETGVTVFRRLIDQFEEIVASCSLIVVVTSVCWGVITRYITEQPAAWASEIATLSFAWLVFFGATACIKYKLHPTIDMLVKSMPSTLQTLIRWMNHLLVLGFCAFMAVYGTMFAIGSWGNPSPVLRLPMTVLYGPVSFCFALMILRYLQVVWGRTWEIDPERETHAG